MKLGRRLIMWVLVLAMLLTDGSVAAMAEAAQAHFDKAAAEATAAQLREDSAPVPASGALEDRDDDLNPEWEKDLDSKWEEASNSVLKLSDSLKVIEEEAFYGDQSIDEVVLPEHLERIEARAFANSSLKKINLPGTLTYIDDTAFDGTLDVQFTAEGQMKAWALDRGLIKDTEKADTSDNAGKSMLASAGKASPLEDFYIDNGETIDYSGPGGNVIIPKVDENIYLSQSTYNRVANAGVCFPDAPSDRLGLGLCYFFRSSP